MERVIRGVLIALAILVVVALAVSDLTGGMMGFGIERQDASGQGMMQGAWWTWGLQMFIFWGVIGISLALVVRALGVGRGHRNSPLDVLKRRYAAGDLTREQYE